MSDQDHHHDHGHNHEHGHDHRLGGHSHAAASFGKAFAIGVALNAGFVVLEVVFGVLGHSVALLVGGHSHAAASFGKAFAIGSGVASVRRKLPRL